MEKTPKKFEDELASLEAIVARIDSGELSLEDSIKAFEEGVGLVRSLNRRLDEVEQKIELLVRDSQGELRTTPYRPDNHETQPRESKPAERSSEVEFKEVRLRTTGRALDEGEDDGEED